METKSKVKGGGGALSRKDLTRPKKDPLLNELKTNEVKNESRFRRYQSWLLDNGCLFPSLGYPVAFWKEGVVGVLAKQDIPPNKAFVFIPYNITINLNTDSDVLNQIYEENEYFFSVHSESSSHRMYLILMYERMKGTESFWFPYFEVIGETETILDWTEEEKTQLQDPFIVYESNLWTQRYQKKFSQISEILSEYPYIFPPLRDLKELFTWALRVFNTRAFGWEDRMLIPLADNINHSNVDVVYHTFFKDDPDSPLEVDFSDFTGKASTTNKPLRFKTNLSRLEKYIKATSDKKPIKSLNAIWEVDRLLGEFSSSSDEETVKNLWEVQSDPPESSEEEEETYLGQEECYFTLYTGEKCSFKKGSQVFSSYGKLSNRDLLLDYGFAMMNNNYDSFYFRMWNKSTGRQGLVTLEDLEASDYKNELHSATLDDFTDLFGLKYTRLNCEVFTYFRQLEDTDVVLKASPSDIELELRISDKVLELYYGFERTFTTSIEEDLSRLDKGARGKLRYALIYRSSLKRILKKQIDMVNKLKEILEQVNSGEPLRNHLKSKSLSEVREVYPLKAYLKSLRANLNQASIEEVPPLES